MADIRDELRLRLQYFQDNNMLVEAQRLEQKTQLDLEMIEELGYCNGIAREEALELVVELRGQGLVGSHDQGRPVQPGDDVALGAALGTGRMRSMQEWARHSGFVAVINAGMFRADDRMRNTAMPLCRPSRSPI